MCVHGFLDTWRTWELLLPVLERHHDVLAPTLPGHAGGVPLPEPLDAEALVDALETAMDEAGFETAHVIGNSLGGRLAFELAVRGRARSVVAFAPPSRRCTTSSGSSSPCSSRSSRCPRAAGEPPS